MLSIPKDDLDLWLNRCQPIIDEARDNGKVTCPPKVARNILMAMKVDCCIVRDQWTHPVRKESFSNGVAPLAMKLFRKYPEATREIARALLNEPYDRTIESTHPFVEASRILDSILLVLILRDAELLPLVAKVAEDASVLLDDPPLGFPPAVHATFIKTYARWTLNAFKNDWRDIWITFEILDGYVAPYAKDAQEQ